MNSSGRSTRNNGGGFLKLVKLFKVAAIFAALALFQSADDVAVVFVNATPFTVRIVVGSGRTDICALAPYGETGVRNLPSRDETYYPLFDVPLTGTFSLKNLRAANRDFYFQIDGRRRNQRIEITAPEHFDDSGAYLILTNASKSGGVFVSRNDSSNRMIPHSAVNNAETVNAGENAVYALNPTETTSFTVRPQNLSSGTMQFQRGMVYRFRFDGASITLTDERPLTRAGEKGWTRTFADAGDILQIVRGAARDAAGAAITVFSSGGNAGIESRLFLSDGKEAAVRRRNLANYNVSGAFSAKDGGYIVLGYGEGGAEFEPVLQRLREDGVLAGELEPSRKPDRRSAFFLAAAESGDGELLAVGGADSGINSAAYKAYIRAVRDTQRDIEPLWELGPAEFDAAGGAKYGAVRAAAFDQRQNVWVITGDVIAYDAMRNPIPGSYTASIDRTGTIVRTDASYKGFLFNRLIIDAMGNRYLAGEENRAGSSYAVILKLDTDGREVWRSRSRPESDSFYMDMLIDEDNNRIVLAGSLRATDPSGAGGMPFIEAVHAGTGELLWRQTLTDSPFRGASLVTGIEKAPFYGFVLALSGIEDGYTAPPFILARVNARGTLQF
ncbi:MAG: hypothetical protein LBP19_02140 [Treponema sp.]|jgi:hypothetical protein|nr:hypothetical protein [Treponema sp.]